MRRDIFHYYEKSFQEVYGAYRTAALQKFGKNCREEPFRTLNFGLNFSLRYNMTGGSCTVHIMPYKSGTAVDLRYTIVQLAGARYSAYDRDLTQYVCKLLDTEAQQVQLTAEMFKDPAPEAPADIDSTVPVQPPVQQTPNFCIYCGSRLAPGSVYCSACGMKVR